MSAGERARLMVLLSGSGRTMLNLASACDRGDLHAEIVHVVASRACVGEERARSMGLSTSIVRGRISAAALDALVMEHRADWVVLAGYLQLVSMTPRLAGRVVNIHPALLPEFGGPGMHGHHVHEAVLREGRRESGCTVHLCDDRYDTGPIILQRRCPVLEGDTPESLAARVFEQECIAYPQALEMLIAQAARRVGS
jgi:formyltetrahydrofolate-dependent phosphoribosylglycinamide formyltransferase